MSEGDEHLVLLVDEHGREILAVLDDDAWRKLQSMGDELTKADRKAPIADGGDDSLANLRPACARCNAGWR